LLLLMLCIAAADAAVYYLQLMRYKRLSPAADVYSFGMVMHHVLTWQQPWRSYTKKEVRHKPTSTCLDSLS
jgi:hypothetical protein